MDKIRDKNPFSQRAKRKTRLCKYRQGANWGVFRRHRDRAITPVRAELRRAVRKLSDNHRSEVCVCNIISVDHLACFYMVCECVTSRMNYSPQVEVFVCQWPHVWGNEREVYRMNHASL